MKKMKAMDMHFNPKEVRIYFGWGRRGGDFWVFCDLFFLESQNKKNHSEEDDSNHYLDEDIDEF